jgi:hypothetical protein
MSSFDDDVPDLEPTARFRVIAATSDTGSHRYSRALGDAIADIGEKLTELAKVVTELRVTQAQHVRRVEVAKIAKEANGKLEGQVETLNTLVFGVLIIIVLAVIGDIFMWTHQQAFRGATPTEIAGGEP